MTSVRSLRALATGALLALAGCFPQATSTSGPASTATPLPAASAAVISTAPVYVANRKATIAPVPAPTQAEEPLKPRAGVTPHNVAMNVTPPGVNVTPPGVNVTPPGVNVTPPGVIPSVAKRSRGTAERVAAELIPPPNYPRILAINISAVDIHSGDKLSGEVQTTRNVKTVEIRIGGWSMPIPRTHAGYFAASGAIPPLPLFVKGKYTLQVIARNAAGLYTERDIPITLR